MGANCDPEDACLNGGAAATTCDGKNKGNYAHREARANFARNGGRYESNGNSNSKTSDWIDQNELNSQGSALGYGP